MGFSSWRITMDRNDVLILIALGVVMALVLLCCGVCILSAWMPRPTVEPTGKDQHYIESLIKDYDKIKISMTEREVDLVLGEENKIERGSYSFKDFIVIIEFKDNKVTRKEIYRKLK